MTQNTHTLAIALIVKNEAHHLAACLETVQDLADEIVIMDSGSTDETLDIARRFTDKIYVHHDWKGFGHQRRLAQTYVTADYVFWLDADERLTPELADSIRAVLRNPELDTVYAISRLTWFFGRFIRHSGWYPDRVVRLYPTVLTRFNDAVVHEKVALNPSITVRTLNGDALHYTYRDLNHYLTKSARYAKAWADQRERQNRTAGIGQAVFHAAACFVTMYLLKAGFLDGRPGLLLALLSSFSTFIKYADLWTRRRNRHAQ